MSVRYNRNSRKCETNKVLSSDPQSRYFSVGVFVATFILAFWKLKYVVESFATGYCGEMLVILIYAYESTHFPQKVFNNNYKFIAF